MYNTDTFDLEQISFIIAILLLNMEAHDAFICLCNLMKKKYFSACLTNNKFKVILFIILKRFYWYSSNILYFHYKIKLNKYFLIYQILFEHNIPDLYNHFDETLLKPEHYLLDWTFVIFAKSLPLDTVFQIWDLFLLKNENFLFQTALGILKLYKEILIEKTSFTQIIRFLIEINDLNFKDLIISIKQIKMSLKKTDFVLEDCIDS